MYKVAEEEINKGLSPISRLILGFFSGVFGVVMILISPPTDKAIYSYAFGSFCLLICLATLTKGRIRQFIGGVIGSALFSLSICYMVSQFTEGAMVSSSRGEPSAINSIFFFLAFGIPGITYTFKTKFGFKNNEKIKKP